jgi:6-phosphofructokinase 1
METENIDIAYISGGKASNETNWELHRECSKRKNGIVTIAFPHSIDNDFHNIDQSIGFDTAVEKLKEITKTMYYEASSVANGVSIIRVMSSLLADEIYQKSSYIHMIVTPEKPFNYCEFEEKMKASGFVCIVISESCENPRLNKNLYNVRYMEPGYIIRGLSANDYDSNICLILSMNAVSGSTQEFSGHTVALQQGIPRFVPSIDVI